MKNNYITLTTQFKKEDIQLNKRYSCFQPNIKYNNNLYKSKIQNNFIQLNVISASVINFQLYNTQRYLDVNEFKSCFRFTPNIIQDQIFFKVSDNIINENNKILLNSYNDLVFNVSAYINHNNNIYFLNNTDCLIHSYTVKSNFYENNYIILPLNKAVYIDLNNYLENRINTFPENLVETYISASFGDDKIRIQNEINYNILSGTFNENDKNIQLHGYYWKNNNDKLYIIPMTLNSYYTNFQLKNNYFISSGLLSAYIMDAKTTTNTIWLKNNQLQKLYYDYNYKNPIFYDIVKFYGTSGFNCTNILRGLSGYTYDQNLKQYNKTQTSLNTNKLLVNLQSKCEDVVLAQSKLEIYVYTQPAIFNKNIYYISTQNKKINATDFIIVNSDKGLTNKILVNKIQQNEIDLTNISATYLIQCEKYNINGQSKIVGSGIINVYPLNVYNTYQPIILSYNQKTLLSGLYTDNEYVCHSNNIKYDSNIFQVTKNIQYFDDLYYLNLSVKNKKKLLNSKKYSIIDQIYYYNELEKQPLSSIIYDVIVYGELFNTSNSNYTLLTKTDVLSGKYLKLNRHKNTINCCSDNIQLTIPSNYVCTYNNINFSWIDNNVFTNQISGCIETYQQFQEFIKLNKNTEYKYIYTNIDTNQQIQYILTTNDIFKFPGIKTYQLNFNDYQAQISNIQQIYNMNYALSTNNVLNLDKYKINFDTYYLNLPEQNNFYIQQSLSSINKSEIKQKLKTFIAEINQLYNISGSFFEYKANTSAITPYIDSYGRYQTELNIYPNNIEYIQNNIIQNYQRYNLCYDLIPLANVYKMDNIAVSGIFYNKEYKSNYCKLQLDKDMFVTAQININKLYSKTSHMILNSVSYNKNVYGIIIKDENTIILRNQIINQLPIRMYIKTNTKGKVAILDLQLR